MRTSSASRAQPANAAANYGRFGNADHMGYVLNQELRAAWRMMRMADPETWYYAQAYERVRTLARIRKAGRLGR